jgi:hypothetical protein
VAAALLLSKRIHLTLKLRVDLDAAWLTYNLWMSIKEDDHCRIKLKVLLA